MILTQQDLAKLKDNTDDLLSFDGRKLTDEDIAAICLTLPNIHAVKYLSLSANNITRHGVKLLVKFSGLRILDLSKSPIDDVSSLSQLPMLSELNLSRTPVTVDSIKALAQWPHLRSLNLTGCTLEVDHLKALADASLTTLNIAGTELDDEKIPYLVISKTLTDLELGANMLSSHGIQTVVQNKRLLKLGLHGNYDIDAQGAIALGNHPTLMELNMGVNEIGDEGLAGLAHSESLTALDVNYTNISDKGVEVLFTNRSLIQLDLYQNELSEALQERLQQHIAENARAAQTRRDTFVQTTLVLADALQRPNTKLSLLSADIMLYVFSFMQFNAIAKSRQQAYGFIEFVLNNYGAIRQALADRQVDSLTFSERIRWQKIAPLLSEGGLFKFMAPAQLPSTWEKVDEELYEPLVKKFKPS